VEIWRKWGYLETMEAWRTAFENIYREEQEREVCRQIAQAKLQKHARRR
jgi:hypothetical protein